MSTNRAQVQRRRRFQVSRRGTLHDGNRSFACLIQDISEKGLLLICNHDLQVGSELAVQFELGAGANFSGRIRIRHFRDGCCGAELVAADHESDRNWNLFLESHYSGQLALAERRRRL
ncbi:MAG: PilZ domain-containing protein [Betaproteobacteria bacterium]